MYFEMAIKQVNYNIDKVEIIDESESETENTSEPE